MPTSHYFQIGEIVSFILFTNPSSTLDIGAGFGKYGFLSREYLELWDGRNNYHDRQRKIHGIEVFEDYITPIHDFIYDRMYIGNAIDILPTLKEQYDLILLIDILEHFDFNEGLRILQECSTRGRNILISVPNYLGHQKDAFGNTFETHKFHWKRYHFKRYNKKFVLNNIGGSLLIYIGENSRDVLSKWRTMKRKHSLLVLRTVNVLETMGLLEPMERLLNKLTKKSN